MLFKFQLFGIADREYVFVVVFGNLNCRLSGSRLDSFPPKAGNAVLQTGRGNVVLQTVSSSAADSQGDAVLQTVSSSTAGRQGDAVLH